MTDLPAWRCLPCARLLVVLPTWLGDTVMGTVVLDAARRALPRTRIIVAGAPALADVLHGHPAVDEFLPAGFKGCLGPIRAARVYRTARADGAILLPGSMRSALAVLLARIPRRAGIARDGRRMLLTDVIQWRPATRPAPTIELYRTLAASLFGAETVPMRPSLMITDQEDASAASVLAGAGGRPLALLVPGASKPDKRWPPERFAQVADALGRDGWSAALAGAPSERAVLRAVSEHARCALLDLSAPAGAAGGRSGVGARFDLGVLKAVIRRATVVITNDTGPRHIALALGTPTVALFGPTDPRWTTIDGAREYVLRAEPFLPGDHVADDHPAGCRMDRIEVADVLWAVRRMTDG